MAGCVRKIICLKPKIEEDIRVLDYRHSSLQDVPSEVFNRERTLEELYVDNNQIRDLPRELFFCHGLRKLSISDNEITNIPPAISTLANLEELDFSKNGIIDVPESIKGCKYLRSIDGSVNPLGKLPEGFTHLNNLTHLYLNDTFLDFLPGSFGRMVNLKILELRENHLKTLPRSFCRLVELERLDVGNNELTELSDVIGGLSNLLELWCDNNQITTISPSIGNLKQLMFLDASNNHLQELPVEVEGCISLADLHLTSNNLMELPASLGNLKNLTTLKVDDNQLTSLPKTLGGLSSLSELNVSANDLEDLPGSIGLLRNLRTFYADENLLQFIPAEMGSCSGITVLSLRCNKLTYIPDELGRIPRLRVLNLSDNLLRCLPFSIIKLKELQALWLAENQTRPLIPLQSEYDADTGRKILTCYLLPQGQVGQNDERDNMGDNESFHASMWDEERLRRQQIHFASADFPDEEGTLVRCPTPYPKEMKQKVRHAHNLALRQMINVRDTGVKSDLGVLDRSLQPTVSFDEKTIGYSKSSENSDLRAREAWTTKPISPRFQETHHLYRYDKEKLLKDKARFMQHRLSMPDFDNSVNVGSKEGRNKDKKGQTSLSRNSGSVPDLTSGSGKEAAAVATDLAKSAVPALSVNSDLYYKQIVFRHKGRRSRRMRDYDSDTGYRSEGDSIRFRHEVKGKSSRGTSSEILSVQSQPLPHRYYHHLQNSGRGKEGLGYVSDVEARGAGSSFPTANAAAAAFQRKQHILSQHPAQSMPYDLDVAAHSHMGISNSSRNFSPSKSEPRYSGRRPSSDYLSYYRRTDTSFDRFNGSASPSNNRTSNLTAGEGTSSAVSNDQFYTYSSSKDHSSSPHVKINKVSDVATTNQHLPTQTHAGTPRADTSFQVQNNSLPVSQGQVNRSSKLASGTSYQSNLSRGLSPVPAFAESVSSTSEGNTSLKQNSCYSVTPSPLAFQKDSFLNQGSMTLQVPAARTNIAQNYATFSVRRASKQSSVLEERPGSQMSQSGQMTPSVQPAVTPPPYNPAPPYRRPDSLRSDRPSSGSSSGHTDISQSTNRQVPVLGISNTGHMPGVPNLNLNQSQSSPCGFHGGSPYPDLPAVPREKLGFSDYADVDHRYQDHYQDSDLEKPVSAGLYKDNHTSRSGSSSSQIGSASQTGAVHLHGVGTRSHDRSDSSDSRSDKHNHSLSRESPQSSSAYGSVQPRQDRLYDHYSSPFDRNYVDITVITNQEQSSQVSSSTDSGYGPGHHVYEKIGNYRKAGSKGYSVQGDQRSQSSPTTSAPVSQRQTSANMSESTHKGARSRNITPNKDSTLPAPDSSTEEYADKFRITIHKNPGLGFSIAGGIGSHGNSYRENDIGIFVTKVSQDGPASKFLRPGDKILEVNGVDFQAIEHNQAVSVLKKNSRVDLLVERIQKVNMV